MKASLGGSIAQVFNKSQLSSADHPKLVKYLQKIYTQDKNEEFLSHFINCLKCALIHGEREASVNLCLDFAAKFAASFENAEDPEEICHPFYEGLFDFLLANHNVKSQAVRFRVCQFINRLLDEMSESATINSDLFDKIYDAMLERIQDRIASVRVQAVIALQRLQDPTNKECPVIKALVFHLERDPHPEVRQAVLRALGCNYFTLDFVLERLRDVKDTVRRQAYMFISERVHVRSLSIANRVTILKLGINDRSPAVTSVVQDKLIPSWVNAMESSLFNLLRGLDVEGCSDIASEVVSVWFKNLGYKEIIASLPTDNDHLLAVENLKPEIALYWSVAVSFLSKEGVHAASELEAILPEMTPFGKYLKGYVSDKLKNADDMEILSMEFVVNQLLQMTPFFDLADEAGRQNLQRDLFDLLQMDSLSPALTRTLVKCVSLIEPKLELRIIRLLEVISELREPLTQVEIPVTEEQQRKQRLEIAQCRVQLNELKDQLEQAVQKQSFAEAQEIQTNISSLESKMVALSKPATVEEEVFREERDDPLTLLKCLSIVCELLKNAPMLKLTKELDQLLTSLILPCVERVDPGVRNAAFEALGSLCTCDLELAQQRLLLFIQAVQMDHTVLQVTTAKVLFDLVQLFGLSSFEDEENGLSLASILTDLLDSEDVDVQTIAVEGFAKLMISSRIESPMILSRLVIFLFHPLTADNTRLRQVLHVFFPFFASMSLANQQQLEAAFLPTVKTIRKAPVTSPLSEIDVSGAIKLFVELTQENILVKKPEVEHTIHDLLAMKLCNGALRSPDSGESKMYLKALLQLSPTFSNPSHTRDLQTLTGNLLQTLKDKNNLRMAEQFDVLVRKNTHCTTSSNSESAVMAEEGAATAASAPPPQQRSRNRQLLSKNGTAFMGDITETDGNASQASSDVFVNLEGDGKSSEGRAKMKSSTGADRADSDVNEPTDEDDIFLSTPPKQKERTGRSGRKAKH